MSFSWSEFYQFAQELYDKKEFTVSEETRYRIIVGRAYYSAFGLLREYISNEKYTLSKTAEAHRELVQFLKQIGKNLNNNDFMKVGEKLNRLREDRRKVDYDKDISDINKMAEKSLIESKIIIDFLKPYGIS